eukprot:473264-Rhodomonas_salina.1
MSEREREEGREESGQDAWFLSPSSSRRSTKKRELSSTGSTYLSSGMRTGVSANNSPVCDSCARPRPRQSLNPRAQAHGRLTSSRIV